MPAGQPTKYNDEVLTKSDEYIKTYDELGDVVPSAAGLADFIGVSKKTLYNWADVHPDSQDRSTPIENEVVLSTQ